MKVQVVATLQEAATDLLKAAENGNTRKIIDLALVLQTTLTGEVEGIAHNAIRRHIYGIQQYAGWLDAEQKEHFAVELSDMADRIQKNTFAKHSLCHGRECERIRGSVGL